MPWVPREMLIHLTTLLGLPIIQAPMAGSQGSALAITSTVMLAVWVVFLCCIHLTGIRKELQLGAPPRPRDPTTSISSGPINSPGLDGAFFFAFLNCSRHISRSCARQSRGDRRRSSAHLPLDGFNCPTYPRHSGRRSSAWASVCPSTRNEFYKEGLGFQFVLSGSATSRGRGAVLRGSRRRCRRRAGPLFRRTREGCFCPANVTVLPFSSHACAAVCVRAVNVQMMHCSRRYR